LSEFLTELSREESGKKRDYTTRARNRPPRLRPLSFQTKRSMSLMALRVIRGTATFWQLLR
jgi:hypothetical protein